MSEKICSKKFLQSKNLCFIFAIIILLALRIWLGRTSGAFITAFEDSDDVLLLNYADFHEHFSQQTLSYNFSLMKDMGYPLFLYLVNKIGIAYVDGISLLWCVSAMMTVAFFKILTENENRKVWLAIYSFVLFHPVAFTYIGLRVYRNAIMTQFYMITLEMTTILFIIFWREIKNDMRKLFLFNFLFGIIFSWTYYIKEDGIWMLACLVSVIILCSAKVIFFDKDIFRNKIFKIVALFMPLFIFCAVTNIYKAVNQKYFGVSLINNRTEGELGRFAKLIYKIESDERTSKIWAPTDAILKAFDASETLKNNERLREAILHSPWRGGDIVANPIQGDFLTWVTLTAVKNSGICKNYVEQENFLKKVNDELDKAFENGTLKKDSRLQIVSSMGGKTLQEIFELRKLIGKIYFDHLICPQETYGIVAAQPEYVLYSYNTDENLNPKIREKYNSVVEKTSRITNMNFFAKNPDSKKSEKISSALRKTYAVLNVIFFITGFMGLIWGIKNFLQKKSDMHGQNVFIAVGCGAFALSFVYSLAISWFADFLSLFLLFNYSSGIIPMLIIFEMAGVTLFFKNFSISKFKIKQADYK